MPSLDRDWRRSAAPKLVEICTQTWPSKYNNNLEAIVKFAVARAEAAMSKAAGSDGGGSDCRFYFTRLPLFNITVKNSARWEHAEKGYPQLKSYLEQNSDGDSVPIVCGRIGHRFAVWDGHHRLRTYQQALRPDIPALIVWIVPGTGTAKIQSPTQMPVLTQASAQSASLG